MHLFPWSNIVDEDMNLSDTFRVPDPKTGQLRRLISQISKDEEAMFRNMLARLNQIIQVCYDFAQRLKNVSGYQNLVNGDIKYYSN